MFDRDTGNVDPAVVAYWRENFDIAHRMKRDWPALKADLDGKIHLIVGTADTFYLDGSARRLALLEKITWEMYSVARPKSPLKPGNP